MPTNDQIPQQVESVSDAEKAKIRAEVRYALIAAEEARPHAKGKTWLDGMLSILSNGFVLLLIGSLLTYLIVPEFQRKAEIRKQQYSLLQECLSQFLLYSNSLWQEYYSTLPLTQLVEIDRAVYLEQIKVISEIKLRRYDAYAKVISLAVAVRPSGDLEEQVRHYAITVNSASEAIDKWLVGMYCTPVKRKASPCAGFNPSFNAYDEHLKIKALITSVGNDSTEKVAAAIVKKMNTY